MATVNQPTTRPTNKLTAATLGSALVAVAAVITDNLAPSWSDPKMWAAITPVVVFACGYLVKDKPNVEPAKEPVRGI